MPDAFFASEKKRKRAPREGTSSSRGRGGSRGSRGGSRGARGNSRAAPSRRQHDSDVSEGESDAGAFDLDTVDFRQGRNETAQSDDDVIDEHETAAEKRVRLAKGYLAKVRSELAAEAEEEGFDAADIDRDIIASRLQEDVAEAQGRIHLFIADKIGEPSTRLLTMPSQSPTSVALSPNALYVSTKRGSISTFTLPDLRRSSVAKTNAKQKTPDGQGHRGEILCLAASQDGKWLVSGGRDKLIGVWDVSGTEPKWKHGMRGHKDAVTSIALPPLNNPSHQILTASLSRHLALHSVSTLSLIDTFFGHQDSITSVSALKPQVAVTSGSRDRTCRWWKVEEEVQLVFRGGAKSILPSETGQPDRKGKGREHVEGSIDIVCMLDDQHFISGSDSGALCLWHTGKKKPIFTHHFAHGTDDLLGETGSMPSPRWITALGALRGTNLFASGSWDGHIRLWALDQGLKSFSPVRTIPIPGFVNDIELLALPQGYLNPAAVGLPEVQETEAEVKRGKTKATQIVLAAAISQEPRLGRWMRLKEGVKNGALIAVLPIPTASSKPE